MPGQVACRDVGRRRAGPMGLEGWWLVSYLPARRARSRRSPVTVQRWPCRGARCSGRDPLVVSPAEGATRRSVTVSRDQPAPQPLREQEQIRAVLWQSQGVSIGLRPEGFTVRGLDRQRSAESCQPGRCLYACVSQERRNRLELRERPFTPRSEWSSAWQSCTTARICPLCWRVQIGSR